MKQFLVICGESGSGKSEIAKVLNDRYGLKEIKTYTTREPRYSGEDTHTFSCIEDYEKAKCDGTIVASTYFDGNTYWTTGNQVDEYDVAIFDINGIRDIRRIYNGDKQVVVIYIKTPIFDRYKYMLKRGDSKSDAMRRIWHDIKAFKGVKKEVDFIVLNKETTIKSIAAGIKYKMYLKGIK